MLISGDDSEKLPPPRDPNLGVGLDRPISGTLFYSTNMLDSILMTAECMKYH